MTTALFAALKNRQLFFSNKPECSTSLRSGFLRNNLPKTNIAIEFRPNQKTIMSAKTTPMMEQYRSIRRSLDSETILFFRLGDFYEMFFEDAYIASEILDITLTNRQGTPMCGVPYHSSEGYLSRLVLAGKKVAIAEQVENPNEVKGIVKREVTSVITPGTIMNDNALAANRNNYIAALNYANNLFGMALLDLSTGAFWIEEIDQISTLQNNITRYAPSECIIPQTLHENAEFQQMVNTGTPFLLSPHDDWTFEFDNAYETLLRHFSLHSLEGFESWKRQN